MISTVVGISLFVTGCIDATFHGQPTTLCREFQIKHYNSIEECDKERNVEAATWLNAIHMIGIDARLKALRCGPSESEGDDI